VNRRTVIAVTATGLVCFGAGAGTNYWLPGKDPSNIAATPRPADRTARPAPRKKPKPAPVPSLPAPALNADQLLALDPATRVQALVDQLPALTGEQLRELAADLVRNDDRASYVLSLLVFTRWGEVDYATAASFLGEHPDMIGRVFIETGRAAVDLPAATRQPLDYDRKRGLKELLRQLPAEQALRIAKKYLHQDDETIAELEAEAQIESGAYEQERETERQNPAAWARSLAEAGRKGDWKTRYGWDNQVVSMAGEWAKTDPDAAITWIGKHATEDVRQKALRAVELKRICARIDADQDPAGALVAISEAMEKFPDQSSSYSDRKLPEPYLRIMADWLVKDRPAALEWLHLHGQEKSYASIEILPDPDQATHEIDNLPQGSLRTSLSKMWTERWIEERPGEAFAWLRANSLFPPPAPMDPDSGSHAAEIDPFAPDPFADTDEPDPYYEKRIHNERMVQVFDAAIEHDPTAAMDLAARSGRADWIADVVDRRNFADPRETIEWLTTIESDWLTVSKGWTAAMRTWTREAPEEAAEWVNAQPAGRGRDAGIEVVIHDLIEDSPDQDHRAAIDWALAASDAPYLEPEWSQTRDESVPTRVKYLERVFRTWTWDVDSREDAIEAREALRSMAEHFDEKTLSKLEQKLDPEKFQP